MVTNWDSDVHRAIAEKDAIVVKPPQGIASALEGLEVVVCSVKSPEYIFLDCHPVHPAAPLPVVVSGDSDFDFTVSIGVMGPNNVTISTMDNEISAESGVDTTAARAGS